MAFQILDYNPALIMTYDGANDRAILEDYYHGGVAYPVGTPEHFDDLSALVDRRDLGALDDDGQTRGERSARGLLKYLFPELAERISARFSGTTHLVDGATTSSPPLPETTLQAGVAKYLSNLARMHDLTTARGARFIAVFQPMAQLHQHFGSKRPFEEDGVIGRFHKAVLARVTHDFEFHDLGSVFDQYYATVPVMDRDITDETVFVDEVHLSDPGNEIVARHLSGLLK